MMKRAAGWGAFLLSSFSRSGQPPSLKKEEPMSERGLYSAFVVLACAAVAVGLVVYGVMS